MAKKISVKPVFANPGSVRGSLSQKGLTRFPNAKMRIPPFLEANGSYRTGLDENALYISRIKDETERKMEIVRVRGLAKLAKELYGEGMDLSPTSDFYTRMTDAKMGTQERCPFAEMKDGDNTYNIEQVKEELITYAYLRVHPDVAPSKKALLESKYAHCRYFVNDSDVEDDSSYNNKKEINKAIVMLDNLSKDKQKKIARQLGLPISESSSEKAVYNALDNFIKNSNKSEGKFNATRFVEVCEIKDENLDIMDLVKLCIQFNILKKEAKTKKIKRGNVPFADNEEHAVAILSDPNNQDDLFSLKSELDIKLNTAK